MFVGTSQPGHAIGIKHVYQHQCAVSGQGRRHCEQRQLSGGAGVGFHPVHAGDVQDNPSRIARAEPRDIDAQIFVVGAAGGDGQRFNCDIMA